MDNDSDSKEDIECLDMDFEALKLEVETEREKSSQCLNDLQLERANFINYKDRVVKDRENDRLFANQRIVEELLDVKDNLERALSAGDGKGVSEGVELTLKQLEVLLKKHGVSEICEIDKFDPKFHEAMIVEKGDVEEECISEILQKGYMLHSRVVRPAKVKIIKPNDEV